MNLLTEQSTMAETIVQNSTTAILTSIFYQALADSIIWLVVAAVVIVCDLLFRAAKRPEKGVSVCAFRGRFAAQSTKCANTCAGSCSALLFR